MGGWGDHLPMLGMVSVQFLNAIMALLNRAALLDGMSPRVFIFYRQAIAALVICPTAYFKGRGSSRPSLDIRIFLLIFVTAFIGVVLYQTAYFEGLFLASSSMANAAINLAPAITFVITAIIGLEQVSMKTITSMAKVLGTTICVGGALSMALLRGPKLLNTQLPPSNSLLLQTTLGGSDEAWLLGCLCLFASCLCWSLCLILQVPITTHFPDHLSLSAWMSILSTLQAGMIALFTERDPSAWNLTSTIELTSCLFSGILGSGYQYFVLSWVVSRRGPFFSTMFAPLCTVITTVMACIILHEELYIGSLLGGMAVIIGLYFVLWGKSKEVKHKLENLDPDNFADNLTNEKARIKADLEQPFLVEESQATNLPSSSS